jgi:NTE family protein
MEEKIKIGLALGGGSARGFAHIGVLKVLEEAGIKADYLAGCSIGALVGAFYASGGKIKMLERFSRAVDRRNWVDLTFSRMGFINGKKIEEILYLMTRRSTFADLKIPLAVVAVDLYSGQKVVLKEGLVSRAVRASISIPGYFVPVEMEGMLLVDGGVLDRVPAGVVRQMGAEFVIAVDTGFYPESGKISTILDVITRSFDIMTREITRNYLINADIVISPDLAGVAPSQFDKAGETIAIGEKAAREALPRILAMLESRGALA